MHRRLPILYLIFMDTMNEERIDNARCFREHEDDYQELLRRFNYILWLLLLLKSIVWRAPNTLTLNSTQNGIQCNNGMNEFGETVGFSGAQQKQMANPPTLTYRILRHIRLEQHTPRSNILRTPQYPTRCIHYLIPLF